MAVGSICCVVSIYLRRFNGMSASVNGITNVRGVFLGLRALLNYCIKMNNFACSNYNNRLLKFQLVIAFRIKQMCLFLGTIFFESVIPLSKHHTRGCSHVVLIIQLRRLKQQEHSLFMYTTCSRLNAHFRMI